MKICLILEGSYPYVHGGVSTWMHQYIRGMKDREFCLWIIGAEKKQQGKFVYDLPENVTGVTEVFLDEALGLSEDGKWSVRFTKQELDALTELMRCGKPDWETLFDLYQRKKMNPVSFLKSEEALAGLTRICMEEYRYIPFADTFHTMRSMLLPVLHLMSTPVPEADVYHSICTGYGGLLAVMGGYLYNRPVLLSEHGIYSREREEEIIRADWVAPTFKNRWIQFYYMLSDAIYSRAFRVTSLFGRASQTQAQLGCDPDKCRVVANGVHYENFCDLPAKAEDGWVDIGAVVRFAPIKDIKTMIYAFFELASRVPKVRLHIMGGVDDETYAEECRQLIGQLRLENVIITGRVQITEYFPKLDFTILTSISEGQPLSILESFAAALPVVSTDVGCCKELIFGEEGDTLGAAGYCVPPMHRLALADAMEQMCRSRQQRLEMGRIGRERVRCYYRHEQMLGSYAKLYEEVETVYGGSRI